MTTVELPLRPIAAPSTDTVRKMQPAVADRRCRVHQRRRDPCRRDRCPCRASADRQDLRGRRARPGRRGASWHSSARPAASRSSAPRSAACSSSAGSRPRCAAFRSSTASVTRRRRSSPTPCVPRWHSSRHRGRQGRVLVPPHEAASGPRRVDRRCSRGVGASRHGRSRQPRAQPRRTGPGGRRRCGRQGTGGRPRPPRCRRTRTTRRCRSTSVVFPA